MKHLSSDPNKVPAKVAQSNSGPIGSKKFTAKLYDFETFRASHLELSQRWHEFQQAIEKSDREGGFQNRNAVRIAAARWLEAYRREVLR